MNFLKELKTLLKPYYWINLLMGFSYLIFKKTPILCDTFYHTLEEKCQLDNRESEILLFLMVVVMIRTRKTGNVTMINYISSSFPYCKGANMFLWFYADFRAGIIYTILITILAICVPEPTYSGPCNVIYFRTALSLDDEISRDKNITWLICFHTIWSPGCSNFAPVFSQLSSEFGLENLKFGKIDVGRYPDAATKYNVNDASTSRQLPTVILFKDGKEFARRPFIDPKGKIIKFFFTEENVKTTFELNDLYKTCKGQLPKKLTLDGIEKKLKKTE